MLEAFVPNLAERLRAVRAWRPGRTAAARDDLARRVEELERSLRALTAAAAVRPVPAPSPPPQPAPPPVDARPARDRPSWLDLVGVLTLLGLLVYGAVAFSYVAYFRSFDVTLEEVGMGYATLLRRSGLNLAVVAASAAIAAVFLSFVGDRRDDSRRGAYGSAAILVFGIGVAGTVWLAAGFGAIDEATIYFEGCWSIAWILGARAVLGPMSPSPGWPRGARAALKAARHPPTPAARRARMKGVLVIAAAVVLGIPLLRLLWSRQDDRGSPWQVALYLVVGMVIVWGPAGLHRARRMLLPPPAPAVLPVVALVVIAVALAGGAHGRRAAETVKDLGDLRRQGDVAQSVLDVSTPRVCVAWVSQAAAPAALPTHELLYLGQSDSILALYDLSAGRPIRVSSDNVMLVELTAAERAARALRICPSGGR
jgi:hypothetical protein